MATKKTPASRAKQHRTYLVLFALFFSTMLSGCTSILSPIDTIPADRLPPQFLAEPRANKVAIDSSRLRQAKPAHYILDEDDILGVFIDGVLGGLDEPPPVQFPQPGSDLPPAIGFPVPIRADGTVSLPLVDPIPLRGLTIQQAEQLITRAFREGPKPILQPSTRVIVTLMQERTYRVFVVRQDNQVAPQFQSRQFAGGVNQRSDESSRGFVLQMPAYKNDVLNALLPTGGIPGINAKPEIRILRGDRISAINRDRQIEDFYRSNRPDSFPYGIVPTVSDESNTLRIPLRLNPGEAPRFRPEDIILRDGDVVYIDSRETDVYYTGGLLGGSEISLPRDYDLDVLAAVARAGTRIGVGNASGSNSLIGSAGSIPPSQLIVLRQLPGENQIAIRVDLNDAINNPRARILVQPGDTLILRFKPQEEIVNFALNTFFTFGVRELFR